MLKSAGLLAVGVVAGVVLGWFFAHARYVQGPDSRQTVHDVKEVVSHREYESEGALSDTELVVYLEGTDGTTGQVLCQFPSGGFHGAAEKVRVGPVSKKLGFGRVGYLCEVVAP
jgi:hypothetical protein